MFDIKYAVYKRLEWYLYNIGLVSLGCDKNRIDSEVMLSDIADKGYKIVNDEKEADIIIINTCGFIDSAKEESIDTILEMAENKKTGKCKGIIVTGCLSQRYKDTLIKEMPEIDAVVGTGNYNDICEVIDGILNKHETGIIKADNINYNYDYNKRILTTPSYYAYIKIAEGCNNNCSFCIIPKLRGKYRSRKMENIIEEAKELADNGVKEIILVAQDTTNYGIDIYKKKMLHVLLSELEKIDGIRWIRILYNYPEEIYDDLINKIKESKKVCHYFDIPLQHINNDLLRSMNRKNTKEDTINLINKIRKEIPDSFIRTSLIVGLPGETDEKFNELVEFVKEYKLDRVGVFTYSKEENTKAAEMENQIDEKVKINRKQILMSIQKDISYEKNKKSIGNIYDVIIDKKIENNMYNGRTKGDAPDIDQKVIVKSTNYNLVPGQIVKVKISRAYFYDVMGDVIDESGK